jgi:hypothetical protein
MRMRKTSLDKLEKTHPERAALVRKMITYLNHLDGLAEDGTMDQHKVTIQLEEDILEAHLGRLPRLY